MQITCSHSAKHSTDFRRTIARQSPEFRRTIAGASPDNRQTIQSPNNRQGFAIFFGETSTLHSEFRAGLGENFRAIPAILSASQKNILHSIGKHFGNPRNFHCHSLTLSPFGFGLLFQGNTNIAHAFMTSTSSCLQFTIDKTAV